MIETMTNGILNSNMALRKAGSLRREQRTSWRYAYEALTHVHSLRLYLFNSMNVLPQQCESLRAYLLPTSPFSSSPVVVCKWMSASRLGESHTVYVPMPFCLIDHSTPFLATAAGDHIEVKLKLLPFGGSFLDGLSFLGFSHRGIPIKRDGGVKTDSQLLDEAPFSLNSDYKLLSDLAKNNLFFYCKHCSAKLTKNAVRQMQELPSTDWRDLADNWFGNCCCANGAQSEQRFTQFERRLRPTERSCLVGSTVCVTHFEDVEVSVDEESRNVNPVVAVEDSTFKNSSDTVEIEGHTSVESAKDESLNDELQSHGHATTTSSIASEMCADSSVTGVENMTGHIHGEACCSEHHGEADPETTPTIQKSPAPDCGFMGGPQAAFSKSSWTSVNCHSCSSLVGVTSGKEDGVQFFKCHISTDGTPGGLSDIFRYHTLGRVFCNELFSHAEENSSYRYIIRGLSSKVPLLQLVLLNQESWNCSGSCIGELSSSDDQEFTDNNGYLGSENNFESALATQDSELMIGIGKEEFLPAFLEPVAKVMFRDTSAFTQEEFSAVEEWGRQQQADDIYVLESEVKALANTLRSNQDLFPESCAAFQQFHFSFLAR